MRPSSILVVLLLALILMAGTQLGHAQPFAPSFTEFSQTNMPATFVGSFATNHDMDGLGHRGVVITDFDGDGFGDVVTALPRRDTPSTFDAGAVAIACGTPYFLRGYGFLDLVSSDGTEGETRISGGASRRGFGSSLATADLNGDGLGDLIVGEPRTDIVDQVPGKAYIIFGTRALRGRFLSNPPTDPQALVLEGTDSDTWFGAAVAAGDFNGDGFYDVAVGEPDAIPDSRFRAGRLTLFFGSIDWPLPPAAGDQTVETMPASSIVIIGSQAGDRLGSAIDCADLDGDGVDDLIVGVPGSFTTGYPQTPGRVLVFFGNRSLPLADIDTAAMPAESAVIVGEDNGDALGRRISTAYLGEDGYADLLLTSAPEPASGREGKAYVVFGGSFGPGDLIDLADGAPATAFGEFRALSAGAEAEFAHTLAGADLDNNGQENLALSIPKPDSMTHMLLYQDGTAAPGAMATANLSLPDSQFIEGTVTRYQAHFPNQTPGYNGMASGDVNGDGLTDLVITSPGFGQPFSYASFTIVSGHPTYDSASASRFNRITDGLTRSFQTDFGPTLRAAISFAGTVTATGADGVASITTATLTRSNETITNLEGMAGDVLWFVESDRTAVSHAEITLRYVQDEVLNIDEESLSIAAAPSPQGPWTDLTITARHPGRNQITGTIARLPSYFALRGPARSIVVDGRLDGGYGPPRAVQTVNTAFGNNTSGAFRASGSELDAIYLANDEEFLYVFLAGNLENNGNIAAALFDLVANDNEFTVLPEVVWARDSWLRADRFQGNALQEGFDPDYFAGFKIFDANSDGA